MLRRKIVLGDVEFVKALYGKKTIHLKNSVAVNSITQCRWCVKFTKSTKREFMKNPCKTCLKIYTDCECMGLIKNDKWIW